MSYLPKRIYRLHVSGMDKYGRTYRGRRTYHVWFDAEDQARNLRHRGFFVAMYESPCDWVQVVDRVIEQ